MYKFQRVWITNSCLFLPEFCSSIFGARILFVIFLITFCFLLQPSSLANGAHRSVSDVQKLKAVQCIRVRPKFGFGYGAETDLTCSFGLVSATAEKN